MKRTELILGLIALAAVILKLFTVTGSGILLVLSFTALAILYYFSFLLLNDIRFRDIFKKKAYKHTTALRIIISVVVGFAFAYTLMGALFKMQFYPGANILLGLGLITTSLVLVFSAISYFQKRTAFYRGVLTRIAVIGGLGLVLFFTKANTLVDVYYKNNPEYAELLKRSMADPDNQELSAQLEELEKQEFYSRNSQDR